MSDDDYLPGGAMAWARAFAAVDKNREQRRPEATMEATTTNPTGSETATKVTIDDLRKWRESVTGIPHGRILTDEERDDVYKAWAPPHLARPDANGVTWQPKTEIGKAVRRVRQNRGKLAIAARIIHQLTPEQRTEAASAFADVFETGGRFVDKRDGTAVLEIDLAEHELVDAFETWLTRKLFDAAKDHEVTAGELPWRASPPELLAAVREIAFAPAE